MPWLGRTNTEHAVPSVSRRRILAAVGTGAFATTTAIPGVAGDETEVEVTDVDDVDRHVLLEQVLDDHRVHRLQESLQGEGWQPVLEDAIVLRSQGDTFERYHTVAIPFSLSESDDQATILWTDDGPFPIQARSFTTLEDGSVRMYTAIVEDDELTTATVEFEPDFWWYICSDINWPCVLTVAGAWAGAIASCAACIIDPTRITCLSCIGAVLAATGGTLGCDICN